MRWIASSKGSKIDMFVAFASLASNDSMPMSSFHCKHKVSNTCLKTTMKLEAMPDIMFDIEDDSVHYTVNSLLSEF